MRYKRPLLTFIAVVVITIVTLSLRLGGSPVSTTMRLAAQYGDGAYGEMPLLNLTPVWFELHCERLLLVVRTNYSIEAYTPAGRTNYDGPFGFSGKAFQFIGAKVQPGNFPVRVGLPANATKFRVKIEMKEYGSIVGRMQLWLWNKFQSTRHFGYLKAAESLDKVPQRGGSRVIYSSWIVRSNNAGLRKAE